MSFETIKGFFQFSKIRVFVFADLIHQQMFSFRASHDDGMRKGLLQCTKNVVKFKDDKLKHLGMMK